MDRVAIVLVKDVHFGGSAAPMPAGSPITIDRAHAEELIAHGAAVLPPAGPAAPAQPAPTPAA